MDFFFFFFFFSFLSLGLYPWHMDDLSRLRVESELQLLAYTTATARWDPSHICNLYHSSWQCRILNPLSEARAWTQVLMDASQVCDCWATTGTPEWTSFLYKFHWPSKRRGTSWLPQAPLFSNTPLPPATSHCFQSLGISKVNLVGQLGESREPLGEWFTQQQ